MLVIFCHCVTGWPRHRENRKCEQERRPAIKEEPGVHRAMSSAGYVHEGEIFRWPGRTLQAFY